MRELAAWYGHRPSIVAVEPREELRGACEAAGADVVVSCGAGEYVERQMRGPLKPFDLIITNPPFSLACDIWDACLQLLRSGGQMVFFQRLSWLSSQARAGFGALPRTDVWVCPGAA